jgi:hypothetical protein
LCWVDRIDASRNYRPGTCERCGNTMPVEKTISTFEIDSERKRHLAEAAVRRFWTVVGARGETGLGDEPIHKVIHLDRALALLTDEEIAQAIGKLENGITENNALVDELRRHRERS